jgi:replicative DNA helicase
MTHDELALLGHLIGDGCTLARQTIHYTTVDLDLAEEVTHLATAVFETKIAPQIQWQTPRDGKGGWYQVYLASSYRLTHGIHNPIATWLRNMGVFGLRSYQKYVPCCVFAQPTEGITCFLRHLWSTDGHAALSNERSGKSKPSIYYATSSERLAKDVQSLLLRLGINARVSRISQGVKGRDQYHVHVSGRPDVYLFIDQVGTVGKRKRDTLDQIRLHINDRVANTNRDVLPSQVWRQIAVPSMAAIGMTSRQMQAALGNAYCGTGLYKQGLSRDRAMRLASVVQSAELALLAQSDVYWDEVISIESDGVEEVYDLTVDGLHNFVANNMVVHNSIEQNADIVLFIYRDEVYNPSTERRGVADIIIAKHRNGPTGTFCLRFEPQTTRFREVTDEVVVPLAPPEDLEIEIDESEDD